MPAQPDRVAPLRRGLVELESAVLHFRAQPPLTAAHPVARVGTEVDHILDRAGNRVLVFRDPWLFARDDEFLRAQREVNAVTTADGLVVVDDDAAESVHLAAGEA